MNPSHSQTLFKFSFLVCLALSSRGSIHADQASTVEVEHAPLTLVQGEQRLLRIPGLRKYSLGGSVLRAHAAPQWSAESLLLKAISPGMGDLWIWKEDGSAEHRTVRVEKWDARHRGSVFERALGSLQETEIYLAGSVATLRGTVSSISEVARIAALLRGFPKEVRDETLHGEALLAAASEALERWIAERARGRPGASPLGVEIEGGRLWVRGQVARASERLSLEREILARFPGAQIELDSFADDARTVHFRVDPLELRKNRFGRFGIAWPGNQAGAFRVTTWGIREALQLELAIDALEAEGSARVLSNPEIAVRAPGEAELFAGGELPIRAVSRNSANVTWRPYGLTLKLKATDLAGDRVRLDIHTEVSSLDLNAPGDEIPSVQANRMKTQVDARFGVPLFLSGLLTQNSRVQARGLPLLRRIPVLGSLFGSEDYLQERSELVAILLPQLSPPPAPMDKLEKPTDSKLAARTALPTGAKPETTIPPATRTVPWKLSKKRSRFEHPRISRDGIRESSSELRAVGAVK